MENQHRDDPKFDVDPDFTLPDLLVWKPEGGAIEVVEQHWESTYLDTPSANLAQFGVTLRQRGEGSEGNWQLAVLGETVTTQAGDLLASPTLPPAAVGPVEGVRAGETVGPAARVSVHRTLHRITTEAGVVLVEIADDRLTGTALVGSSRPSVWRELTVLPGSTGRPKHRRRVEDRLLAVGAVPAGPSFELQRTLGLPQPRTADTTTVGELAWTYVAAQCQEIVRGDVGLRLDQPLVHKFRVAIRRLRSTLRVFAPLFDPTAAAELETELVWIAGLLGEVRDREVLMERLGRQLEELPPEVVLGPVAAHIETTLLAERSHHRARVAEAMDGARYQTLLQTLLRWQTAPPLTARASKPVTNAARYVRRAEQKVDQRLATAGGDVDALHGARKAAKRYRYAAELSAVVGGRHAARIVKTTTELQTLLGDHQDSVVSAEFLRRMGAEAGGDGGQNGFTYGFLLAQEWQRAQQLRDEAERRWGGR